MKNAPNPSASQRRRLLTPPRSAAIVYVLAAVAIWFWYPRFPQVVIDAGRMAQFAGFTPDGQSMVTFHKTGSIQFWNMHSGHRELSIEIDQPPAEALIEFSTDGKRLSIYRGHDNFTLGRDYYRVETGAKLSSVNFAGRAYNKKFVSESPDGLIIACGNYDATLVYDTATGDLRCQVVAGTAAAFSDDGKTLAVGAKTDAGGWTVTFFDPITGDEQHTVAQGDGIVSRITFSPQGDKLALAVWQETRGPSDTRGVQLWDIASETREQVLPISGQAVTNLGRLRFLADGHVIYASGFFLGFAWDLTVPAPDNLVGKTGGTFFPTVHSPDGRLAALKDHKAKTITVRRLGIGKEEIVWRRGGESGFPVGITPDARLIVSHYPENGGLVWKMAKVFPGLGSRYDVFDITGGGRLGRIPLVAKFGAVAVSPDGRTLVTTDFSPKAPGRFTLWNVPTATPWLAIFGFAAIPAVAVGLLLRKRQPSPHEKVAA